MKLIKNRITRSCATQTQRMKYLCAQRAQQPTRIHEDLRSKPTASSNANPDTNHNSFPVRLQTAYYQNSHYAHRVAVNIRCSGKVRYPTTWRLSWTYLASQDRILLDPYPFMAHNHACTLFDVTYVLYRSYHKVVNYRILKTAIWTPYSQQSVDGWKKEGLLGYFRIWHKFVCGCLSSK